MTKDLEKQLDHMTEELTNNMLANQRCDFTGWSITECLSSFVFEFKRMNDLKEKELDSK